MESDTVKLLVTITKIKCLLCKESFRSKYNLRNHLKRNHTEVEAEAFIKKVRRRKIAL